MIVKRFFHIRPGAGLKSKFNGATVLVIGDTDMPAQVDVQVAFCSKKDPYTKSVGRDMASKAPLKIVMLRYQPVELAGIEDTVHGYPLDNSGDYLFSMRYFLPKE